MTGGPPVRGDLLPLWRPAGAPSPEDREIWRVAGQSIAIGVELVAHLEPVLDLDALLVGFCCDSEDLAEFLAQRVRAENVDAEHCRAHPGSRIQSQACDVVLPCRPGASREEIDHAVLAAVKAAHGVLCPTGARAR